MFVSSHLQIRTSRNKKQLEIESVLPQNYFDREVVAGEEPENQNIMFNPVISCEKMVKTFVFEREDTQQSTIADYEIDLLTDRIDLGAILERHCPLAANRVSIYDPSTCKFASLVRLRAQAGLIPKYLFEPAIVLVRFIQKGSLIIDSDSYNSLPEGEERSGDPRQGRSKERTIGEVLQVIKKWRHLHLHGHAALRRRLNLQDAAKMVGISKKSLDDYYCQLRLGQLYHFDYVSNINEKMGVLRTYVKNYRPGKQQTRRRQNDKHPKNLKILNYYDLGSHGLKNVEELLQEEQYRVLSEVDECQQEDVKEQCDPKKAHISAMLQPLSSFSIQEGPIGKQLFKLQHQFFKGFEIPVDEEGDPYHQLEKAIHKPEIQYDSNSMMLYD